MSARVDFYRAELRSCEDWLDYLRAHSNLPGPRGNLELAEAAYQEGSLVLFQKMLAADSAQIAENTPDAFVVFCGVMGLGKAVLSGDPTGWAELKRYANDPRWRVREAVAMALQKIGRSVMPDLLAEMNVWKDGKYLEQRAVVAGLCEPDLLEDKRVVKMVLEILDHITAQVTRAPDRKDEKFRTLRQALAYGWSVAAAADKEAGKPALEGWFNTTDPDVRWIMRENLKKNRLMRLDAAWVQKWRMEV